MDIRLYTRVIIRKHGKYLTGYGKWFARWSESPYDAWYTRDKELAERIARKCGGVMILFNPVAGQMKII